VGLVQSEAHRHLIEKELVLVVIWLKRNCWVGIKQQWLTHSCLVSYLHALSVSSYVLYLCWFYRSYSCHSFFVFLFSSLSQLILYARSCSLYPYVYNVTILCLLQYEIKDFERSVSSYLSKSFFGRSQYLVEMYSVICARMRKDCIGN
jgi:hypothetical protein